MTELKRSKFKVIKCYLVVVHLYRQSVLSF